MPFPVIGVTAPNGTHLGHPAVLLMRAYVQVLVEAGATPVLLSSCQSGESWRSLYERVDGILFSGGGDINPARFHGKPHPSVHNVDDERDAFEFLLLQEAAIDKKPFLGICRGFQVVNVGLGGTLYTDIKTQVHTKVKHRNSSRTRRSYLAHEMKAVADSHLSGIVGQAAFPVNSMHHQGAKEVAPSLKPVAYAPDGLVEGL